MGDDNKKSNNQIVIDENALKTVPSDSFKTTFTNIIIGAMSAVLWGADPQNTSALINDSGPNAKSFLASILNALKPEEIVNGQNDDGNNKSKNGSKSRKSLIDCISSNGNAIHVLVDNAKEISSGTSKNQGARDLDDYTQILKTIAELPEAVELQNKVYSIGEIIGNSSNPAEGTLFAIIRNLESFHFDDEKIEDNFRPLNEVFDALDSLSKFGLFAAIKMRMNMFFIEKIVIKQLPEFMKKVDDTFKKGDIGDIGLRNLENFFDAIMNISNIDIKRKLKFKANLIFVEKFVIKNLADIIKKFYFL